MQLSMMGLTRVVTAVILITRADLGAAGVAGELGHGVAVAVDILVDGLVVHEVALEHVLGIGDALLRNGDAVGKLDGVAAQGAGDLQLVEAERRGGSLEAAAHVHGGIQADGNGDGHVLAALAVLVKERAQVTAARGDPHGKLVLVDAGEAMDGHVGLGAVGARAVGEAHGDVGAAVDGVLVGAGTILRRSKPSSVALYTTSDVDVRTLGDLLGAIKFSKRLPISRPGAPRPGRAGRQRVCGWQACRCRP